MGPLTSLLVARGGLKRVTVAWGALMRRAYATVRRRGAGSRALSYWSDNEAGYSFWSVPQDLGKWGEPEALFRALHAGYKAAGVPVVQWEIDSNFIAGAPNAWFGGWCWHSWRDWNATFYPSGGNLSALLDGAPLALYVSSFCQDTVHKAEGFSFVDVGNPPAAVAHPDDAQRFYTSILAPAVKAWGMQHFFTDFLCFRGPKLAAALPTYYAADAAWLRGMTLAASDLGLEVQYCMACAHQALQSLQWPAVTNARANGDGGMDLPPLVYATVMAASVGLGWSKDNLRLRVWGQGDSELQTLLAALSLGPVGLSDELEGYPAPLQPGETPPIVTNVTLALSTCTSNGTLLQPSFPLTPVEEVLLNASGMGPEGGHAWATFTTVPGATGAWFVALGFAAGGGRCCPPLPCCPAISRRFSTGMAPRAPPPTRPISRMCQGGTLWARAPPFPPTAQAATWRGTRASPAHPPLAPTLPPFLPPPPPPSLLHPTHPR